MTEKLSDERLLPCPFCGGEVRVADGVEEVCGGAWEVGCWGNWNPDACAVGPAVSAKTKAEAITAWNRRASPHGEAGNRQSITEAIRMMNCPRPCNNRPDEFTVGECVDAGECGCVAGNGISPAPTVPVGVTVKPLEWEEPSSKNNHCWVARTIIGDYCVACEGGWWYAVMDEGFRPWEWEPPKDARSYSGPQVFMDACQADYEASIRSALVASPNNSAGEDYFTPVTVTHHTAKEGTRFAIASPSPQGMEEAVRQLQQLREEAHRMAELFGPADQNRTIHNARATAFYAATKVVRALTGKGGE